MREITAADYDTAEHSGAKAPAVRSQHHRGLLRIVWIGGKESTTMDCGQVDMIREFTGLPGTVKNAGRLPALRTYCADGLVRVARQVVDWTKMPR